MPTHIPTLLRRSLTWSPAIPWLNGMRTPPAHLPQEIRDRMVQQTQRRLRRSTRLILIMLLMFLVWIPAQTLLFVSAVRGWVMAGSTGMPLLFKIGALFLPCLLAMVLLFRLFSRPIILGIVDQVWWENSVCPRCDYDLHATPERCPECGTVPAGSKKS